MSRFPLDIVNFDNKNEFELDTAIKICNSIQSDFVFTKCSREITSQFYLIHLEEIDGDEFLNNATDIKKDLSGYFPYMLFISSNPLSSEGWSNIYASTSSEHGVSIITTDNVPDIIIPKERLTTYFVYYFARVLIKLLLVGKYNHSNPSKNGCLFDFMKDGHIEEYEAKCNL